MAWVWTATVRSSCVFRVTGVLCALGRPRPAGPAVPLGLKTYNPVALHTSVRAHFFKEILVAETNPTPSQNASTPDLGTVGGMAAGAAVGSLIGPMGAAAGALVGAVAGKRAGRAIKR